MVVSHGNLYAQIEAMILAWGWTSRDVILHVLPLHHIHGIVNVLMAPLHCGATCVMLTKFDPHIVSSDFYFIHNSLVENKAVTSKVTNTSWQKRLE